MLLTFREFIQETFDSSLPIKRMIPSSSNLPQTYYVEMGKHQYRILVFEVVPYGYPVEIGFERLTPKGWKTLGKYGDIPMKDLLALFGTIQNIVSQNSYDQLVFGVDEEEEEEVQNRKIKIYVKMIRKFQKDKKYSIVQIQRDHIIIARDKSSFEKYIHFKRSKLNREHL